MNTINTVNSKDGTTIAFDKAGQGPAIILVAGATATRAFGFAGLIDVTGFLAETGRVCTAGFTSKCFSTSAGNKSSRRSRIAFPHTDARERFNHFEICAADAVGQRPMSREISWVVQGIIVNLTSSP